MLQPVINASGVELEHKTGSILVLFMCFKREVSYLVGKKRPIRRVLLILEALLKIFIRTTRFEPDVLVKTDSQWVGSFEESLCLVILEKE